MGRGQDSKELRLVTTCSLMISRHLQAGWRVMRKKGLLSESSRSLLQGDQGNGGVGEHRQS